MMCVYVGAVTTYAPVTRTKPDGGATIWAEAKESVAMMIASFMVKGGSGEVWCGECGCVRVCRVRVCRGGVSEVMCFGGLFDRRGRAVADGLQCVAVGGDMAALRQPKDKHGCHCPVSSPSAYFSSQHAA